MNKKIIIFIVLLMAFCSGAGPIFAQIPDEEIDSSLIDEKPGVVINSDNTDLLSVNFYDVEIQAALSALAMEREINITAAQEVSGKISVHLYHVTLDDALNAITLAGGFSFQKRGDFYHVFKPKDDRDMQADRLQMKIFTLNYAPVEKVQDILDAIPGLRTVKVHEPTRTIVAEDTPENIEKLETVLNIWDKRPMQVLIEAKILEVELTDEMSFGINWEKLHLDGRLGTGGLSTATLPATGSISPVPDTGAGFFWNIIKGAGSESQFALALDALQAKTKVHTLSTPKILVINGKKARVQVGGQQGYKVTTVSEGIATESIAFIDTGTILEITPYIEEGGTILMEVAPSIDAARVEQGIPVVKTTTVSTFLVAQNGQTVFIGGLIQDTKTRTRDGIPFLSSIPGLGTLFSRTFSGTGKSELVILITPKIITPGMEIAKKAYIEKTQHIEESLDKNSNPTLNRLHDLIMPVE